MSRKLAQTNVWNYKNIIFGFFYWSIGHFDEISLNNIAPVEKRQERFLFWNFAPIRRVRRWVDFLIFAVVKIAKNRRNYGLTIIDFVEISTDQLLSVLSRRCTVLKRYLFALFGTVVRNRRVFVQFLFGFVRVTSVWLSRNAVWKSYVMDYRQNQYDLAKLEKSQRFQTRFQPDLCSELYFFRHIPQRHVAQSF